MNVRFFEVKTVNFNMIRMDYLDKGYQGICPKMMKG